MANCRTCRKQLSIVERLAGVCHECVDRDHKSAVKAREEGSLPGASSFDAAASLITLSTEALHPNPTAERLGIVTASCIYGAHLGKDIMAAWRDVFGGRAVSAEKIFADARNDCLEELRISAAKLGATAVIATVITQQELAGGGKSMIMVTATGTAIRDGKDKAA